MVSFCSCWLADTNVDVVVVGGGGVVSFQNKQRNVPICSEIDLLFFKAIKKQRHFCMQKRLHKISPKLTGILMNKDVNTYNVLFARVRVLLARN